jgi:phenazine biosynthesis protein phzE
MDVVDILVGDVVAVDSLADLPLPEVPAEGAGHDLLALVPYRQVTERGFACRDDGSPLLAMVVTAQGKASTAEVRQRVPDLAIQLRDGQFDIDDSGYAALVRQVLADDIGRGEGSNFVIRRTFTATVTDFSPRAALAVFRRLLGRELGAYCTFLVHTADVTLVGATPERHVSVTDGTVVMNPICGTYRYPPTGPTVDDVLTFLADRKEADELYMVVDEELKMMGRICDQGGRVVGPFLKEMARLAHTEYLLHGHTERDVREVLHETLLAPTVTGSPLESACRVIARREQRGRGYYGGVLALISHEAGKRSLDASIMIRTAQIDRGGRLEIGVGATLVRHSDPISEAAETRTKAAGLLDVFDSTDNSGPAPVTGAGLGDDQRVRHALAARNATLSSFWFRPPADAAYVDPLLAHRRVLVIDAEDTFTAMLGHQLRSLGPQVTIRGYDKAAAAVAAGREADPYDLVVIGPGPGDPRDLSDPKIAALHAATMRLIAVRTPFLSVCLGHQILADALGLRLIRREVPNQGTQREIDFFGHRYRVGFYNTFAARCAADHFRTDLIPGRIDVSRAPNSGEVYGMRGPTFRSVQFHPESVLTERGPEILAGLLRPLLSITEARTAPEVLVR